MTDYFEMTPNLRQMRESMEISVNARADRIIGEVLTGADIEEATRRHLGRAFLEGVQHCIAAQRRQLREKGLPVRPVELVLPELMIERELDRG